MSTVKSNSESTLVNQAASQAQRLPWSVPAVSRLPMGHTETSHGNNGGHHS